MKQLKIWKFLLEQLESNNPVVLMCVLESSGSSPGRQGFKMAVTANALMGSIGGGIMEHKMVELAKERLQVESNLAITKKQVHHKNSAQNQSGMICSGEQTIFLYLVREKEKKHLTKIIESLEANRNGLLEINSDGFCFYEKLIPELDYRFDRKTDELWEYEEKLGYKNQLYIIGGGHCSLALSKMMTELDFYVHVFDERENLNTMNENQYAKQIEVLKSFEGIQAKIPEGNSTYIVVMTVGYRSDLIVLKELLKANYPYIGLLGSQTKVDRIMQELTDQGYDACLLQKLFGPVGLQIKSQTPEEIAVSIAAEIIQVKNANK